MEKLLTARQVADHLGWHVKTLYRRIRKNEIALNFVRLPGRGIAFRPQDVALFVELHVVERDGSGTTINCRIECKVEEIIADSQFMTDEEARVCLGTNVRYFIARKRGQRIASANWSAEQSINRLGNGRCI